MNGDGAPPGIDTSRPSVARVYDFVLGGKDNFAIDRQTAEMVLRINPDAPEAARANRAFLRRAVRFMADEAGIDQFLDIGSGLPTQGNVHEVVAAVNPAARVVYVDNDPMVLAHGRVLLAQSPTTTVIQADLHDPGAIIDHADTRRLIDFDRPVGLLLVAILHHVNDDEDPGGLAARLIDVLAPGSYVAISHFMDPGDAYPEESRKAKEVERIFAETLGTGRFRTHDEVLAYFAGLELLEPGLVPLAEWRPVPGEYNEQKDTYHTMVGGVARKGR